MDPHHVFPHVGAFYDVGPGMSTSGVEGASGPFAFRPWMAFAMLNALSRAP
jgi:hypothetical protein